MPIVYCNASSTSNISYNIPGDADTAAGCIIAALQQLLAQYSLAKLHDCKLCRPEIEGT